MQWEYQVDLVHDEEDVVPMMNGHGADGWEAFAILQIGIRRLVYFKRRVPGPVGPKFVQS